MTRSTDQRPSLRSIAPNARLGGRRSRKGGLRHFKLSTICLLAGGLAASGGALASETYDLHVQTVLILGLEFQGGQALLAVSMENKEAAATITDISASFDIGTQLPGWTYLLGPQTVCAGFDPPGVTFDGTTVLSLTGLTLDAGEFCSANAYLQIPIDAPPGPYNISATGSGKVGSTVVTANGQHSWPPSTYYVLGGLTFEKEFIGDAYAGGVAELRFTITNRDPTYPHQDIAFTDDLGAALTGLASISGPQDDVCGAGSLLSGTNELTFAGGALPPSGTCSFSVFVEVPAGADPNLYSNETSTITSNLDADPISGLRAYTGDTASADLTVLGASALINHTQGIIERFVWNRAGTLMGAGPYFSHYVNRFYGNIQSGVNFAPLAYQTIPNGGGGAAFDAVMMDPESRWAIWLEGTFERYRLGGPGTEINGGVAMLQGGFDVLLGDNLILGLTVVGDGARELSTDLGYFVEGLGWMAGPYGAIRLGEGVVFDAKLLWGQSWNDISPFLTYTDQFTTTRWLATARLVGEAAIGPLMFRPEVYVAYFNETQGEYVDTNGITIPEQTIVLGRLTFGPEIAIPIRTSGGGMIEPRIAMEGVWDFIGTQPISARLNGGIQFSGAGGASLLLAGGYGGLFAPAFSNWNIKANLTVPLQ